MASGERKKILVVDDSATARAQIMGLLEPEFECSSAADGEEGLRKTRTEQPDALVVDLEMPQLDGIALLRELRSNTETQSLPVVIVTTEASIDRVNECRALHCAGFVLKPLEAEYLRAKLRQLFRDGSTPSTP